MAIYLIDKKKWFLLTKEEARSNIQPYLLY
jgi:hypothetical protein